MSKLYIPKWAVLVLALSFFQSVAVSQFTEQWVARYTGAQNNPDIGRAVAVDDKGNVYVTGYTTINSTNSDYATIKYDAAGKVLWIKTYDGNAGLTDIASTIAVDKMGNVYISGGSVGAGTSNDFATIKYDGNGTEQWVRKYNGPANSYDVATAIGLDGAGNIYVTGIVTTSENNTDIATIKYDGNGNQLWIRSHGGTAGGADAAVSIAVSNSAHVFVSGRTTNRGTQSDATLVKYDSDGNEIWVRTSNRPADDDARFVTVDALGNSYITGSATVNGSITDYLTIKYDASGNMLWTRLYDGTASNNDYATMLAIDAAGNVYVTGWSSGTGSFFDYATIKYSGDGNELWVRRYNGPLNSVDNAQAIVSTGGNVYVTGTTTGLNNNNEIVTLGYDAAGNQVSLNTYGGPGNGYDVPYSMTADAAGNIYVVGESAGVGTAADVTTIKYGKPLPMKVDAGDDKVIYSGYSSDCMVLSVKVDGGNPPYSYEWSPGGHKTPEFKVCPAKTTIYTVTVTDASGNIATDQVTVNVIDVRCQKNKILVCHKGKELCVDKHAVEAHLKHGDKLGAVDCEKDPPAIKSFKVDVNPNPFSQSARISYEVPEQGHVLITIFDQKGRLIALPVNTDRRPGRYFVDFNPTNLHNGTYYYTAILISKTKTYFKNGKMLKIR